MTQIADPRDETVASAPDGRDVTYHASDGLLLISTPNIQHVLSRLLFLIRGELRHFDSSIFYSQRHMSPLTDEHLRMFAAAVGLELLARCGDLAIRWASGGAP